MFEEVLSRVETSLEVPYPERALLIQELAADLEAAYRAQRSRGLSDEVAREAALRELALRPEEIQSLETIHLPAIRRVLARLPAPGREWLEAFSTALPLAACVYLIFMEAPMILFIREGGMFSFVVLAVGALGIFLTLQRLVIWFILRNHSLPALRKNTATPLYLAAATLGLGLLGTAIGYYVVLEAWSAGRLSPEDFRVGMREPLSCVILGAALSTLTVLLHGALQVGLRAIRIPETTPATPPGP